MPLAAIPLHAMPCRNFLQHVLRAITNVPSPKQMPKSIMNKRAVNNPRNRDQQCFKWSILAKHVVGENKFWVNKNYTEHEDKYIFNGVSFPTPLWHCQIFLHLKKIINNSVRCAHAHKTSTRAASPATTRKRFKWIPLCQTRLARPCVNNSIPPWKILFDVVFFEQSLFSFSL